MSNFVEIRDKDGVLLGQLPVSKEGGRLRRITVFDTAGAHQYTKPSWLKCIRGYGCGGGGGGAGAGITSASNYSLGAGGSGAASSIFFFSAEELPDTVDITIGAGGVGGTAENGTNGGTSSFGTLVTMPGGLGGTYVAPIPAPAVGGNLGASPGVGGILNLGGRPSTYTRATSGAAGPTSTSFGGATGLFGGEGRGSYNVDGYNGTAPGAGGGGVSHNVSQAVNRTGGNGSPGIIIIEEYE